MSAKDIVPVEQSISQAQKEVLQAECNRLYQTNGVLRPKDLVDVASHEGHPLHDVFEWNDEIAAEKFRLQQARVLIVTVKLELANGNDVNHYVNVRVSDNEGNEQRGYVPLSFALKEQSLKDQIISSALKEARYWESKYHDYKELAGVINSDKIREVESKISK